MRKNALLFLMYLSNLYAHAANASEEISENIKEEICEEICKNEEGWNWKKGILAAGIFTVSVLTYVLVGAHSDN